MGTKNALDYHKELSELQVLTASITYTLEHFKLTYDWIYNKYEEEYRNVKNPLPFGATGLASHAMTISMAEDDLNKAYTIIKNRQDFIEKRLSSHSF
ncbi:hypothetical protein P9D43_20955 [Neobacillus niacini]|uniref:hypothetical protein n=1 Tax=Neobacillus niacini TaxID=86668 RepID=UPI0007AC2A4A|nr:hypothetical protein [Neobacillus niacini]MEC1524476.1 hypothetical protein [Neobacillus niacini]